MHMPQVMLYCTDYHIQGKSFSCMNYTVNVLFHVSLGCTDRGLGQYV